jgi:hypothetical protein
MTKNLPERLVESAIDFLRVYSPRKPPLFMTDSSSTMNPEETIREALAEAQFIITSTADKALRTRIGFLNSLRRKQFYVNMLHFLTGSAFISLIALQNPVAVKWFGAVLSLIAGTLALTLPRDLGSLESGIEKDVEVLCSLAGEITRLQTELLVKNARDDNELQERIFHVIASATGLSRKYELEQLAALNGYFPRAKYLPAHSEQSAKA